MSERINYEAMKKDRRITMQVPMHVLDAVKARAKALNMPYRAMSGS